MSRKDVTTLLVLRAYRDTQVHRCEALVSITGECEKVCFRAIEREHDRGMIDYGMSLGNGWLTMAGLSELKRLDAIEARSPPPHTADTPTASAPDASPPPSVR